MIHRALKLIRQFHSVKQAELAEKFGMSKSYLSEIESGKKTVSFELLEKYSEEFEISTSSLVFFSESVSNKNTIPEKFKQFSSGKILDLMEWFVAKDRATQ
ncbi:helix-turn-helix transcriptional regulator [uncultured Microbulbifer sp.]|uniref:helix-turn-helix domain-containing protein n=1 Tax=uncultured Microbulbifer sp. TaxID=348147 RepID=UPI00262611E9|nr:helix-turn-helix transcriptional regulator [uncultured Microbulbifer sp.]